MTRSDAFHAERNILRHLKSFFQGHVIFWSTCTDLPDEYTIGRLDEKGRLILEEHNLEDLVSYKDDLRCRECEVHFYCGGRCPVQILAGSIVRARQYCELMRRHVEAVRRHLPEIRELMERMDLNPQELYDRSAFMTAYTDVVP